METGLTLREQEIINFFSNGLTTKEIGEELEVSFFTVDSHRKHILEKLNARNLPHAIRRAVERGFLRGISIHVTTYNIPE